MGSWILGSWTLGRAANKFISFTKNGVHSATPLGALISQELGCSGSVADDFHPLHSVSLAPRLTRAGEAGVLRGAVEIVARIDGTEMAAVADPGERLLSALVIVLRLYRSNSATIHFVYFGTTCTPGLRVLRVGHEVG
jgi:hypothetical protein